MSIIFVFPRFFRIGLFLILRHNYGIGEHFFVGVGDGPWQPSISKWDVTVKLVRGGVKYHPAGPDRHLDPVQTLLPFDGHLLFWKCSCLKRDKVAMILQCYAPVAYSMHIYFPCDSFPTHTSYLMFNLHGYIYLYYLSTVNCILRFSPLNRLFMHTLHLVKYLSFVMIHTDGLGST